MSGAAGRIERRLLLLLLACLLAPLAFGSCARNQIGGGGVDDPPNRVDWAMLSGPSGSRALVRSTFPVTPAPPRPTPPPGVPEDKLHPQLRSLLSTAPPGTLLEVLVTFRDTLQVPRFPERLPPGHPKHAMREAVVQLMIQRIRNQRTADYDTLADSLLAYGTIQDRDSHWLLRAMLMIVPVEKLLPLAIQREVVYIQPRYAGEPPPWTGPNTGPTAAADDVINAREAAGAIDYYTPHGDGRIGLVDTGVYRGNDLLASPDRIHETWNTLVFPHVLETNPLWEACPGSAGHGTGSASILSGNHKLGASHLGFTRATLNVYKVYKSVMDAQGNCSSELDGNAAALAIQKSVDNGDRVVLVETQSTAAGWAAISQAADRAYRAGAVVIAPVGNLGAGNIGSPGNARGTIAVGAWDIQTRAWYSGASRGTYEKRFKPDLEALTGIEVASGPASDEMTALIKTSGAAPVIGGAGLLLRNFMKGSAGSIDAGKVYAALILGGTETSNFNTHGAGQMRLPTAAHLLDWGKVEVAATAGEVIEVNVVAGTRIAAAVWWPENLEFDNLGYPLDRHNDVEIELLPPGSSTPITSTPHFEGVFERIEEAISGRTGIWTLRIVPKDFVTPKQWVFWAIARDPVTAAQAIASEGVSNGCGCNCSSCTP